MVVAPPGGSAARRSQSAGTDTSPDADAHGGGEDGGAWSAVGPERVQQLPPSMGAAGEDGAGLVAPSERTVSVRSPGAIQWTDLHSSWRRRPRKRAAPGVGPSPAGTVDIRLGRPCS